MLGARELPLGGGAGPPLHASTASPRRAGVSKPQLYLIADGYPRALSVGRGPAGLDRSPSAQGLLRAAPPAELEGVLAHELAHVARRDVLVQTIAVVLAATLIELSRIGGWLERALLFVLGPVASALRPPAAVAEARARRRPHRGRALRARRTASPTRCSGSSRPRARRVPGKPGDGAALHDQPVRERGPRGAVPHPPAARRARSGGCGTSTRTGARSSAPRRRPGGPRERGRLRAPSRRNWRRPTLPGGCPPSTIGAGGLNFSVRNGKRCFPAAMTAEIVRAPRVMRAPSKLHSEQQSVFKIKTSGN